MYATLAQLSTEDQLIAQAQERGAPSIPADQAALLLGATQALLEAQLGAPATDGRADGADQVTGSGLRRDQAAAAFAVLTSDRRTEILVGPAGSGKTYTAAAIAAAWRRAGIGEVHGLAVSQAARNVLHDAGVATADNVAKFLGHLEGRREALGARQVAPRTLLIIDEASTTPIADLAAIVRLAAANDCRVLLTGRPRAARRRGRRRRDGDAGQAAGVHPAGRAGAVRRRLGTRRLAAVAGRRYKRAHRLRRARQAPGR